MIRVGIEFAFFDESWIGGVAAIANLVNAVKALENPRIELVLIAGNRTPRALLGGMDGVSVLTTDLIDRSHWLSWAGRAMRRAIGRNFLLELWLKRHRIDVFSHCSPLGPRAKAVTVGHIADFSYKYFKNLYPAGVFSRKDQATAQICNEYDYLLLSSRSVESDFRRFLPSASATSAVLNIVPSGIPDQQLSRNKIVEKYGIPDRYIYSPNQFWVHKNHLSIVEALAVAKQKGHRVDVVCTGRTFDERRPRHFDNVMRRARELEVDDRFHVLGIVPYSDAMDLMRHSMAVLSASLFEGWGISVTEAKLLGKAILLSDIPVFREQTPERARYFNPEDTGQLASLLIEACRTYSQQEDDEAAIKQRKRWPELIRQYAEGFEDIVIRAASRSTGARAPAQPGQS